MCACAHSDWRSRTARARALAVVNLVEKIIIEFRKSVASPRVCVCFCGLALFVRDGVMVECVRIRIRNTHTHTYPR